VQDRGKTGKGSKTMMDVLIPVAERFSELADREPSVPLILVELPKEAARGTLATRDMLATKGRASFLGERSLGHIDPGARSSEIMITAVCERIGKGATP
jgi:dihydroxyacetone kinase-like protein